MGLHLKEWTLIQIRYWLAAPTGVHPPLPLRYIVDQKVCEYIDTLNFLKIGTEHARMCIFRNNCCVVPKEVCKRTVANYQNRDNFDQLKEEHQTKNYTISTYVRT